MSEKFERFKFTAPELHPIAVSAEQIAQRNELFAYEEVKTYVKDVLVASGITCKNIKNVGCQVQEAKPGQYFNPLASRFHLDGSESSYLGIFATSTHTRYATGSINVHPRIVEKARRRSIFMYRRIMSDYLVIDTLKAEVSQQTRIQNPERYKDTSFDWLLELINHFEEYTESVQIDSIDVEQAPDSHLLFGKVNKILHAGSKRLEDEPESRLFFRIFANKLSVK